MLVVLAAGVAYAGDDAAVEARAYSAYSDPQKPVLSYILSEEGNVEEFQDEFGLSEARVGDVLAVVRKENEKLSTEYAESEKIVESSEKVSKEKIKGKIAASDYDEKVRSAVAGTKNGVEDLLPKGRGADLEAWIDEQWQQETLEARTSSESTTARATSSGLLCKVYATQYIGYTNYEVALPHRNLKFNGGFRVRVRYGDLRAWAPVKEVGPWNTYDNYWQTGAQRTMWKNLPRCVPEAQRAYYHNYNGGKDEFGREVLNPAGVDLTPAMAARIGLKKYESRWVYVFFPWVRR